MNNCKGTPRRGRTGEYECAECGRCWDADEVPESHCAQAVKIDRNGKPIARRGLPFNENPPAAYAARPIIPPKNPPAPRNRWPEMLQPAQSEPSAVQIAEAVESIAVRPLTYCKGPWKYRYSAGRITIEAVGSGWVSRDIARADASTMAAFWREGNGTLMAKAPELIELLRWAQPKLTQWLGDQLTKGTPSDNETCEKLRQIDLLLAMLVPSCD